jgi:hypothetical protein
MEPEGSLPHSQVPLYGPILSNIDPIHALTSHVLKIHLNITLPSTTGSFPQVSPLKPCFIPLLSPIRATCPAHFIFLYLITRKTLGEGYRSFSSSLCSNMKFSIYLKYYLKIQFLPCGEPNAPPSTRFCSLGKQSTIFC